MRFSDAQREEAAAQLGRAYAEGYLSLETLSERLDGVYGADRDVAALVEDLPTRAGTWRRAWARLAETIAARRLALAVELPAEAERRPVLIGRSESCDFVVQDDTVSRVHAELTLHGRTAYVRDLASMNGTWVNGVRVESAVLRPGDVLDLGGFRLRAR